MASFLGNAWTALVQLAFVPVYLALLGVEAFGMIGVYAILQALLGILDLGLTPTLSREAARFAAGAVAAQGMRDLLRSIEWVFLAVGVTVAMAVAVAAPWIATRWLGVESLPLSTAIQALQMMGLLVALRWISGLYRSAIVGLQHLVWLNAVTSAFATLRAAGVVPVLLWVSPTLEAFFTFQCAVTAVEAALLGLRTWRSFRAMSRPAFSTRALRDVGTFAGGMGLISAMYLALSQADKIVLSAMLPLSAFGVYALASSAAGALSLLVAPIGQVAYPRLNHLAASGDAESLAAGFHSLAQLMTLAVAPAAIVLSMFAQPLLFAWTTDPAVSVAAAPLLALLAIGAMLNAFMGAPYMVPLAHGRTRGLVALNAGLLLVFLPLVVWGVTRWGALAGALAWVVINALGVMAALSLMTPHLDASHRWRWLVEDVACPALLAAGAAGVVSLMPAPGASPAGAVLHAILAYAAALFSAIIAAPASRRWLAARLVG